MEGSLILFTSDMHNYCCITIYVSDNDIEFIILIYVHIITCTHMDKTDGQFLNLL